ncbi:hypothetical protein MKX03_030557 [Papaver bracteatum]|nr:hypothetical protein MKX03_030557 [Papaver bracteatum]
MSNRKDSYRWQTSETANQDSCIQTMIDYAERSDRDAKNKLNSMNQKLKDIERQLETVEKQVTKASYN